MMASLHTRVCCGTSISRSDLHVYGTVKQSMQNAVLDSLQVQMIKGLHMLKLACCFNALTLL